MTYPSNALETAFDHVDNKLRSRDSQGGITLTGPYGAGKSHGLLTLYHLFNSPDIGQEWLDEWEIALDVPDSVEANILSTSETDADHIWEPIFEDLGREDISEDVKRYVTTDHIEDLCSDKPVAIFFDEIETWWESFSDSEDEELVERNEFFIQNLLEVANDPDEDLFVFITLLDKSDDFKRILNRTNPYAVDLNATGDRERIILHRLFETRREELDDNKVRDIVQNYVENYSYPIEIEEEKRYENRMVETYPFHPELLDLLDNLYGGGKERQNVRGAMNILADTVRRLYQETNLIVTSDTEAAAFRGINQTLFNRYVSDLDSVEDIDYGEELLKTILLYTLDERSQMASVTECLLGTYKPGKNSVSKLDMSLQNLYGTAHYLDRDEQKTNYYITEDPKLTALVTREQERVLDGDREAIEEKLAEVVRDDVWDGGVVVYPEDDVSDSRDISVVVMLDYLSNGALEKKLNGFFEGRTYQNTVLFVTPNQKIRQDDDLISKAARVLGAENLRGKVDDEQGELEKIIRDERRELRNELEDNYGSWVKWTDSGGGLRMRKKSVSPDVEDVKSKVGRDKTYIGEKIVDEVQDAENGVNVASMLNDFRQFRRMPVVLEDSAFYSALGQLYRDGKIILESDRAKFYATQKGDPLPDLDDDLTIHYPDNLDESVYTETEPEPDTTGTGGVTTGSSIGTGDGTTTTVGQTETETGSGGETVSTETETKTVQLEGNSPRVLRSVAESRVNADSDTATHIDLSYDLDDLSKEELIEFLEQLPSAIHIDAQVVIENEIQD
jgi:hypothetical protein